MIEEPARKLAVLLHADVAGSTELVRRDETLAHRRMHDTFLRLSATVTAHGGIAHEIRGDALVAEFSRASDAVSAAVAFQVANASHNEGIDDGIRPLVRVGIAMGEVVVADRTITGEGVVLAQRLEQLAVPGGVCIQDAAYQTVPKRMAFSYEYLGEQTLKGFDEPVRAYAVRVGGDQALAATTPASSVDAPLALADKPSIAVLPFENLSNDEEQAFFADGLASDLIGGLSRVRHLFVISRNSSFAVREKRLGTRACAGELGVRYLLEGSVRRAGDRIRVAVELIDASGDRQLWSEKYDGTVSDLFDFQDDITRAVVASIPTQVLLSEAAISARKPPAEMRTWELLSKAHMAFYRFTRESLAEAEELAGRALAMEPDNARAHAILAAVLGHLPYVLGMRDAAGSARKAVTFAERAIALDPDDEMAWWALGVAVGDLGNTGQAIAHFRRAIEINPNCADAYGMLGDYLATAGRFDEAIENEHLSLSLNPRDPTVFFRYAGLSAAHFGRREYEEALAWARKSVQRNQSLYYAWMYLVLCYMALGRKDEASAAVKNWLAAMPWCTVTALREANESNMLPHGGTQASERSVQSLRDAGLPE